MKPGLRFLQPEFGASFWKYAVRALALLHSPLSFNRQIHVTPAVGWPLPLRRGRPGETAEEVPPGECRTSAPPARTDPVANAGPPDKTQPYSAAG